MDQRDEARLQRISAELADSLVAALPGWLERMATERASAGGRPLRVDERDRVVAAARGVTTEIEPHVRSVLTADVDQGAGNPLAVLRDSVGPINELLHDLGVTPPQRDRVAVEMFPDDTYHLGPAAFSDVDTSLQEQGIVWGAARAHIHRQRHGSPKSASVGSSTVSDRPQFEQVLSMVADVEGWMTDDQARALHDRATDLAADEIMVEIGSFRGRSMIVLALAAGADVELIAIDPHGGGDRGPGEISPDQDRGDEDHRVFMANLAAAGVTDRVRHIRERSDTAIDEFDGEVSLLYVDGAHRFGPARSDIVGWGDKVRLGGVMLVHDSFSSIGVTSALFTTTFFGGRWRYAGRTQSMAEFQRVDLGLLGRASNSARQLLQLPWFVRNVVIKVLITAKLKPLTRLLGHRGSDWPY